MKTSHLPVVQITPVHRMEAGGRFAEGDYVTRDGTDVHRCTNLCDAGDSADFVCVVAPQSGWTTAGEVESNLTRRYSRVSYTPKMQLGRDADDDQVTS
ncbi:hypothetical protein [Variovorax sp. W2I14]|uniref:hypothetical protein n=1 Tax=Variovorax sp. W2I14 TaxID=3042290 RepID=UPI003D2273A1